MSVSTEFPGKEETIRFCLDNRLHRIMSLILQDRLEIPELKELFEESKCKEFYQYCTKDLKCNQSEFGILCMALNDYVPPKILIDLTEQQTFRISLDEDGETTESEGDKEVIALPRRQPMNLDAGDEKKQASDEDIDLQDAKEDAQLVVNNNSNNNHYKVRANNNINQEYLYQHPKYPNPTGKAVPNNGARYTDAEVKVLQELIQDRICEDQIIYIFQKKQRITICTN